MNMQRLGSFANRSSANEGVASSGSGVSEPLSRRLFLRTSVHAALGLTVAISFPLEAMAASGPGKTGADAIKQAALDANAFVQVTPDNKIIVTIKHLEMGQGAYTGLVTLVAEEMDADWTQLVARNAPADAKKYNNLLWGESQGTGGSTGLANCYMQMREAGAAARYLLVSAAAQQWNVPRETLTTSKGRISHAASNRSATYGEFASLASTQKLPEKLTLKSPEQFVFIGKKTRRMDVGKTDGSAVFTQDIHLPDMVVAVVAHPPRFGATLKTVHKDAALASSGVLAVVTIPSGVAVIAKDFWQAKKGRDALQLEWDESHAITLSSSELLKQYHASAKQSGKIASTRGDIHKGFAEATRVIEATYEFPYLAHAAMEPLNCVVQQKADGVEVWNGCQLQTGDQYALSKVFGISPQQVKINTLYAGGSFGRRANPHSDYVVETAEIAKAYAQKVPVKLMWTREDDMRAGYFRPLYVHRLKAGLNAKGEIVAWHQHIVGQSITKGTAFENFMVKDGVDITSVEGAANLPYAIGNFQVELTTVDPGVPVQWWRSVGSTHTAFATEHFIDQLAKAADKDPVQFRLALLQQHPRHAGVLKLAAEKAGWGKLLPEGTSLGIAVHESFNTYVAQVAQIKRNASGRFELEKVVCAVDCGVAVNPDVITAQMEGGIGYGLSPALMSANTLMQGKVAESNFHDYRVVRMQDMPAVEVHIMPSVEPPTGVGEPGTPVIAPAIANALFATTGKTYVRLPLDEKLS